MVAVLLVEDEASIADLYALRLRLDGYAVSIAGSLAAADREFWQRRPKVVCLDVRLPDGHGLDLAERFAAAGASIVLFTNDQSGFERPPPGVCLALLKASTSPAQLSAAVSELASQAG